MQFQNPNAEEIKAFLQKIRTVAVVGLSPDPDRPSYSVAMYLQSAGYRVVPVRRERATGAARPRVALDSPDEILGEKVFRSLGDIPFPVDAVDIFRKATLAGAHVDEALALGIPGVWLQEGVIDEAAARRAREAGVFVAMDRCMLKEHRKLLPSRRR